MMIVKHVIVYYSRFGHTQRIVQADSYLATTQVKALEASSDQKLEVDASQTT